MECFSRQYRSFRVNKKKKKKKEERRRKERPLRLIFGEHRDPIAWSKNRKGNTLRATLDY